MVCGGLTAATTTSSSTTTTLDDLFSSQDMEVDVGMEWLSIFVEDCLSSKGSCLLPPAKASAGPIAISPATSDPPASSSYMRKPPPFQGFAGAGKARSKRKRIAATNSKAPLTHSPLSPAVHVLHHHLLGSDPPLLDQAYWLADSELIAPKVSAALAAAAAAAAEEERPTRKSKSTAPQETGESEELKVTTMEVLTQQQPRRCSHCLSQRTPQWRAGPLGPKTLCNACGVRYKSGRLLPEYRPAKSPTFISFLHSNSHKKVMEMRNGTGVGESE
ncbi:hypothetical protein SAY86_013020 [Trapa natans]|uniref:GATA-type domain-containing protein n=1 Tax=Trapa natans TaxID=22666 RepID=A0AAN7LXN8_TRANT|nr:hypothetical protein SAY86_013020 [Trapa natans]